MRLMSRNGLDRLLKNQLAGGYKASGSAVMTSYRMLHKPAIMGKAVNKMGELKLKHVNNGVLTIIRNIERQKGEMRSRKSMKQKSVNDVWNNK